MKISLGEIEDGQSSIGTQRITIVVGCIEFEHRDVQNLANNSHQLGLSGARGSMNQHVDPGFALGLDRFQIRQQETQAHL